MSAFASKELISHSTLVASSTDSNAKNCYGVGCNIMNVRQTAPNDESHHLTDWKSAPDASCKEVTVEADFSKYSTGSFSVSSMSVLFDAQDGGSNATKLSLNYANGGSMDVAAYLLCTRAMVEDDGNTVAWDICAFNSEAPRGTFDGVNGATWTFVPVPEKGNGPCQVGIFEIQMHGVESVGAVISVGAMVGIVIAILALVSIGAVCFIRQSNLRKRAARWLNQPRGGWESLELWAADRADHHDNNTNNSS